MPKYFIAEIPEEHQGGFNINQTINSFISNHLNRLPSTVIFRGYQERPPRFLFIVTTEEDYNVHHLLTTLGPTEFGIASIRSCEFAEQAAMTLHEPVEAVRQHLESKISGKQELMDCYAAFANRHSKFRMTLNALYQGIGIDTRDPNVDPRNWQSWQVIQLHEYLFLQSELSFLSKKKPSERGTINDFTQRFVHAEEKQTDDRIPSIDIDFKLTLPHTGHAVAQHRVLADVIRNIITNELHLPTDQVRESQAQLPNDQLRIVLASYRADELNMIAEKIRVGIFENALNRFVTIRTLCFNNQPISMTARDENSWRTEFISLFFKVFMNQSRSYQPLSPSWFGFFGRFSEHFATMDNVKGLNGNFISSHVGIFNDVIATRMLPNNRERIYWLAFICFVCVSVPGRKYDRDLINDDFFSEIFAVRAEDDVQRTMQLVCGLFYFDIHIKQSISRDDVHPLTALFKLACSIAEFPKERRTAETLLVRLLNHSRRLDSKLRQQFFAEHIVALLNKLDDNCIEILLEGCRAFTYGHEFKRTELCSAAVRQIIRTSNGMIATLAANEPETACGAEAILYEFSDSFPPDRLLEILHQLQPATVYFLKNERDQEFVDEYQHRLNKLKELFSRTQNPFYFEIALTVLEQAATRAKHSRNVTNEVSAVCHQFLIFVLKKPGNAAHQLLAMARRLKALHRTLHSRHQKSKALDDQTELLNTIVETVGLLKMFHHDNPMSLRATIWLFRHTKHSLLVHPLPRSVLAQHNIPIMALLTRDLGSLIRVNKAGMPLSIRAYPAFGNVALCTLWYRDSGNETESNNVLTVFDSTDRLNSFADGTTTAHLCALKGDIDFREQNRELAEKTDQYGATPKFFHTCFHAKDKTIDNEDVETYLVSFIQQASSEDGKLILHRCALHYLQNNVTRMKGTALSTLVANYFSGIAQRDLDCTAMSLAADCTAIFIATLQTGLRGNAFRRHVKPLIEASITRHCHMSVHIPTFLARTNLFFTAAPQPDNPEVVIGEELITDESSKKMSAENQTDAAAHLTYCVHDLKYEELHEGIERLVAEIEDKINDLLKRFPLDDMLQSTLLSIHNAIFKISVHLGEAAHQRRLTPLRKTLTNVFSYVDIPPAREYIEALLNLLDAAHQLNFDATLIRNQNDEISNLQRRFATELDYEFAQDVRRRTIESERLLIQRSNKPSRTTSVAAKSTKPQQKIKHRVATTSFTSATSIDVESIKSLLIEFVFPGANLKLLTSEPNTIEVTGYRADLNPVTIESHLARLGMKMVVKNNIITLRMTAHEMSYVRDHWETHFPQPDKKAAAKIAKSENTVVEVKTVEVTTAADIPQSDPLLTMQNIDLLRAVVAKLLGCEIDHIANEWIDDEPFPANDRRAKLKLRFTVKNAENGINVGDKKRLDPAQLVDALTAAFEACDQSIDSLKGQTTSRKFYLLDRVRLIDVVKNPEKYSDVATAFQTRFSDIKTKTTEYFARHTPVVFHKPAAETPLSAPKKSTSFAQWKGLFAPHNNQTIYDNGIAFHLAHARLALRNLDKLKQRSTRLYVFHIFCAIDLLNEREKCSVAANDFNLDALRQTLRHHIEQMNFEKLVANTRDLFSALADINMASQSIKADFNEDSIEDNIAFLQQLPQRLDQKHTLDQQRGVTEFEHLKELLSHDLDEIDVYDAALSCCVIKEAKLSLDKLSHDLIANVSGIVGHTASWVVAVESNPYPLEATLRHAFEALQSVLQARSAMTVAKAM